MDTVFAAIAGAKPALWAVTKSGGSLVASNTTIPKELLATPAATTGDHASTAAVVDGVPMLVAGVALSASNTLMLGRSLDASVTKHLDGDVLATTSFVTPASSGAISLEAARGLAVNDCEAKIVDGAPIAAHRIAQSDVYLVVAGPR